MNDGGPAFPRASNPEAADFGREGMSLRDYFAAAALSGFCCSGNYPYGDYYSLAHKSYEIADLMLRERENGK